MKRIIFLFLLFTSSALSQPLCTVSGTISNYNLSGYSIRTGLIKELRRSGVIVPYRDAPITVSTTGQVRFQVPQTVGTDTTKIRIYLPAPGWTGVGDQGVWVAIPHGATATLNSLVSVPYVAPAYPVVTPVQLFFDSTGNTIFPSDTLWLGAGLAAVPKGAGSNDYAIINTSTGTSTDTASLSYRIDVARDIANGKADADSMKLAFDRLGDRADADSVILKSDTTSLHAQKFAVLTDQVAGKADGDSVSTALQSKVSISDSTTRYATPTQVYTTVNDSLDKVVRSEVDPTATAKAQAVTADSLKPFPVGLKAAGPLGYVWGTLPGGAQGWKPDSAGTAVDTTQLVGTKRNETIYGNKDFDGTIAGDNAVFDRDSTQSFGRLIHGQTKRDTSAQVTLKNDSLYVLPGELKEPTRLAKATFSVGYQDFIVYMWRNNVNRADLWGGVRIVADSANGFELAGVDYDNYALFGGAPSLGSSRVIGHIYNNNATGWVWAAGNTNYGMRPITISPLNTSSTRARLYLNFNASGNNQMNYGEFRVRVHFYSASPATSTYYVKIEPQQ